MIKDAFNEEYIAVVSGDYQVNSALLDLEFDYIFFTGSVKCRENSNGKSK